MVKSFYFEINLLICFVALAASQNLTSTVPLETLPIIDPENNSKPEDPVIAPSPSIEDRNDSPSENNYKGCFYDHFVRDIDGAFHSDSFNNTPANCIELCSSYFFKYSGVQAGSQCWCGDYYNRYGVTGNCDRSCPNNSFQNCGGRWANSVYDNSIDTSNIISKTVCEKTIRNITCPDFTSINVVYAMYGRVSRTKCVNFDSVVYSDKCMSDVKKTTDLVKSMCSSKTSCSLSPDPNVYENNCIGVNKYLEVKYTCEIVNINMSAERPM